MMDIKMLEIIQTGVLKEIVEIAAFSSYSTEARINDIKAVIAKYEEFMQEANP